MPVLPFNTPELTVAVLLKQPQLLSRALSSLTFQRFIADRIFIQGSPESVAGGSARFQRSESIFTSRGAEKVPARSNLPRAGWTESVLTALVETYGLEVPINDVAIRRNQIDQIRRGLVKLANSIVSAVDAEAMDLILSDPDVHTSAASGDWSTAATDIIKDIATVMKVVREENEGYNIDTMVVHEDQNLDLIVDADIRGVMPRETPVNPVLTGRAAPILGLRQILVTTVSSMQGKVVLMDSNMAGTIADEAVAPEEGYTSYTPEGHRPIHTKVYREERSKDWIIQGIRVPGMWIAEPKSIYVLTTA